MSKQFYQMVVNFQTTEKAEIADIELQFTKAGTTDDSADNQTQGLNFIY